MIGASKILTVSYGTFSCTLEGFDEPFNTMKAIAEYFRDLAAEDRYFGAEPPTPDAAMLHKIAEREIHRRVEAKIQENGVILRTGDALDAPPPAKAVIVAPAVAALIDHDDQPLLADASASADSVAAKLSRLRASAAAAAVTGAAPVVKAESYNEDQHADDFPIPAVFEDGPNANPPIAQPTAALIDDEYDKIDANDQDNIDIATEENEPSPEVLIADDDTNEEEYDQIATMGDPSDSADQDAIDDLERLDGVTADYLDQVILTDIADHQPLFDDQPEAAISAAAAPAQITIAEDTLAADDALLASLGQLIDEDDHVDRATLDDDFEDEFDGLDVSFASDPALTKAMNDVPLNDIISGESAPPALSSLTPDDTTDEIAEPETVQRARARVIKIRRADAPAVVAEAVLARQPSLLSEEAEAALQAELAALEAEVEPAPPAEDMLPEVEHDADFDAQLDSIATEIAAEPAPAPVRPHRPVRSITVARAAADASETVGVLADEPVKLADEETPSAQSVTEDFLQAEDAAEARHDIEGDLADEAVGRLMAQTNSALDGEDVKRRQSAIAHLKAAVAATEADRLITHNQPKDDLTENYRSDLESVVRPMRPTSGEARVANADRPQPLVLVSAQRIDRLSRSDVMPRPDTAPRMVAPVRPRRIAGGAMASAQQDSLLGSAEDALDEDEGLDDAAINMFAETESFADFADRLGASDLPDLLEAAAVYCASVLGRPEFSRPLVLRQIATMPATADLSREDGLRVFGTLLRQGRIAKTRRGQFAVTDRSPILAEAVRTAS